MTVFHLVRHASHGLLGRRLAGRMPGVPLSEAGHAEAVGLADALGSRSVAAVVSSPLERAQATAAPIAARHGLPVLTESGLNEIDFGAWTGMAFDALHGPDWQAWNEARSLAPTPGGETMLAAQARAMAVLTRLHAERRDQDIVLVSHQDVLKSVLAQVLGMPLDLLHRFDLLPASHSVVTMWDGGARVDRINGRA